MIPMEPETLAIFPHAIKTLFYNSLQYHSPTIHLWGLGPPQSENSRPPEWPGQGFFRECGYTAYACCFPVFSPLLSNNIRKNL